MSQVNVYCVGLGNHFSKSLAEVLRDFVVNVKLTAKSLENLRDKEKLDGKILENLKLLENHLFEEERNFLNAVEKKINHDSSIEQEQTNKYKKLILKHANFVKKPVTTINTPVRLCDINNDRLSKAEEEFQLRGVDSLRFSEFDKILEQAIVDRSKDGDREQLFVISTPPETHFELARKCLEKEFHVYVDKPITLDSLSAKKLVDLAETNRRIMVVGAQRRFEPVYKNILNEVPNIGVIKKLHYHNHGNFRRFDPFFNESNIIPNGSGYHAIDTILWLLAEIYHDVSPLRLLEAIIQKYEENPYYCIGFDAFFIYDGDTAKFPVTISCSNLPPRDTIDELLIITGTGGEIQLKRRAVPRSPKPGETQLISWDEKKACVTIKDLNVTAKTGNNGAPLEKMIEGISGQKKGNIKSTGKDALATIQVIDAIIKKGITV